MTTNTTYDPRDNFADRLADGTPVLLSGPHASLTDPGAVEAIDAALDAGVPAAVLAQPDGPWWYVVVAVLTEVEFADWTGDVTEGLVFARLVLDTGDIREDADTDGEG